MSITSDTRVLVLGGTGMLGSMVVDVLAGERGLPVTATARSTDAIPRIEGVNWRAFGGADDLDLVDSHAWIVNAIGVIKPFIHDEDPGEVENAIRMNSLFPHELAATAAQSGASVIQIATDCVYSGAKGDYAEGDPHDALDVYGKTKSLGETPAAHVHHIRTSIIGPEMGRCRSLLEWFLGQPKGASVNGFTNHRWNGISTYHFARVCAGIISGGVQPPARHHLVPSGEVTKFELLEAFASAFGREDITISPVEASSVIDRTLATSDAATNEELWRAAGYDTPPSVPEMVTELARYEYHLKSPTRAARV
jgi:dTDP-4-dehydrorhamnose reductase